MYDIKMISKAYDGTKLNTVYLRHKPENTDKIIRLRESMIVDGWLGRPVILVDAGDHHLALTGAYRLAAAQGLDDDAAPQKSISRRVPVLVWLKYQGASRIFICWRGLVFIWHAH